MKTALILVDIQNDFLPGGNLAVPHGDEVIAVANREIQGGYDHVVATQDWHPRHHLSFASMHAGHKVGDMIDLDGLPQMLWPDHCVQGTRGAEFAFSLALPETAEIFQKGTDPAIDSYSGFFDNGRRNATGLGDFLISRDVSRLVILGLATDYCVKATAIDAPSLGFETTLLLAGCRGVDLKPGDVDAAVKDMKQAGVRIDSGQG